VVLHVAWWVGEVWVMLAGVAGVIGVIEASGRVHMGVISELSVRCDSTGKKEVVRAGGCAVVDGSLGA
jgi:hypothetical protein